MLTSHEGRDKAVKWLNFLDSLQDGTTVRVLGISMLTLLCFLCLKGPLDRTEGAHFLNTPQISDSRIWHKYTSTLPSNSSVSVKTNNKIETWDGNHCSPVSATLMHYFYSLFLKIAAPPQNPLGLCACQTLARKNSLNGIPQVIRTDKGG